MSTLGDSSLRSRGYMTAGAVGKTNARIDAITSDGRVTEFKLWAPGGLLPNAQLDMYREFVQHMADPRTLFNPAPPGWEWVNVQGSNVCNKPYSEWLVLPEPEWQLQRKRRYLR